MKKLFLKKISIVSLVIILRVLLFSAVHASVPSPGMDNIDCHAHMACAACPVLIASDAPCEQSFLTQTQVFLQAPPRLPDPIKDSFYHPPK